MNTLLVVLRAFILNQWSWSPVLSFGLRMAIDSRHLWLSFTSTQLIICSGLLLLFGFSLYARNLQIARQASAIVSANRP